MSRSESPACSSGHHAYGASGGAVAAAGVLAMENGAFLAGIAISRNLPMLVELAIATDGLVIVFIMGVLTRAIEQHVGTTAVGSLASLKETATTTKEEAMVAK